MNSQVIQIAARIRELREILEIPQEEVAEKVGISLEEYKKYESAQDDIPTVSYTHLDVYKRQ